MVGLLQLGLNREWMPVGGESRKASSLFRRQRARPVRCHRVGRQQPAPPTVCSATFLPGGLCVPGVPAALLYAHKMRLSSFTLRVDAGSTHIMLRAGVHRLFDESVVSVEGQDELQGVALEACWGVLLQPLRQPLVLHVDKLAAVGWHLWATNTLQKLIWHPETRRDLYRLDQPSFVPLWRKAAQWGKCAERRKLRQLVAAACRKVHGVKLRLSLVLRVPFGLQGLHSSLAQSFKAMLAECSVHPAATCGWRV